MSNVVKSKWNLKILDDGIRYDELSNEEKEENEDTFNEEGAKK
ncbi:MULTISPECIES: hypothetical protein [Bacillus]|nr:hypothetical protein [Bacillus toyonensis]